MLFNQANHTVSFINFVLYKNTPKSLILMTLSTNCVCLMHSLHQTTDTFSYTVKFFAKDGNIMKPSIDGIIRDNGGHWLY